MLLGDACALILFNSKDKRIWAQAFSRILPTTPPCHPAQPAALLVFSAHRRVASSSTPETYF